MKKNKLKFNKKFLSFFLDNKPFNSYYLNDFLSCLYENYIMEDNILKKILLWNPEFMEINVEKLNFSKKELNIFLEKEKIPIQIIAKYPEFIKNILKEEYFKIITGDNSISKELKCNLNLYIKRNFLELKKLDITRVLKFLYAILYYLYNDTLLFICNNLTSEEVKLLFENNIYCRLSHKLFSELIKNHYIPEDECKIPKKYLRFYRFLINQSDDIGLTKEEIIKNFPFLLTDTNSRVRNAVTNIIRNGNKCIIGNDSYFLSDNQYKKIKEIIKENSNE